jgi:Flp pilus assembly protein TadG
MKSRDFVHLRGQVIPLFALLAVVLLGMSALAVDVGYYRYVQRLQQSATDAAAIAGANELVFSQSNATNAAYGSANTNGYPTPAATVSVNPSYTDAFTTGSTGAVQVTITKSYPKFFGAVYGSGSQSISTTAVASLSNNGSACMILLDQSSAGLTSSGGSIDSPACGVQMNCGPVTAGGTFTVASFTYYTPTPGGACSPVTSGSSFTIGGTANASPTLSAGAQNPCPIIAGCNYLTNNPPSTSGCNPTVVPTKNITLTAGCYNGIVASGVTITLTASATTPYVFTSSITGSGITVNGSGVTISFTSGSLVASGSTYNLSPPTSGNYAGVTLYEPPSDTQGPTLSGTGSNLSGLFYTPGATTTVSGSFGAYALFIAYSIVASGTGFSLTGPPVNGSLIPIATLVE